MVDAGFLSIIPPIVAIVLALVTKEVIFSLLLGVFSGTIIYSALAGLGPFGVLSTTVETVSYTHLDVYKRQVLPHSRFQQVGFQIAN